METIKRYHMKRRRQQVVDNVILYLVTPLVCALLCSSPIWFPSLCSSLKALFFVTLPHTFSVFITSKSLFILGNLIVVLLVRESKIFASSDSSSPAAEATPTNTVYDEYVMRRHSLQHSTSVVVVQTSNDEDGEKKEEVEWSVECVEEEATVHVEPPQDLNKRADDFIARVNRQRRLEADC